MVQKLMVKVADDIKRPLPSAAELKPLVIVRLFRVTSALLRISKHLTVLSPSILNPWPSMTKLVRPLIVTVLEIKMSATSLIIALLVNAAVSSASAVTMVSMVAGSGHIISSVGEHVWAEALHTVAPQHA
jgi:hypothetical protein